MPKSYQILFFVLPLAWTLQCCVEESRGYQLPPEEAQREEKVHKITGLSVVGPPRAVGDSSFRVIAQTGSQWISLMPYAFCRKDSQKVWHNHERQWWGEKPEGVLTCIRLAREQNLKIMLKPHLWIGWGGFTGDFGFEKEEDWTLWEEEFAEYILGYARMADSMEVELFCIGTEMKRSVVNRPHFWKKLIADIRANYSGKITYAANWDSYPLFPYWESLDYIGIDAYFPLSEAQTPSLKELKKAWKPLLTKLEKFSADKGKPMLFTEYGYRSVDYTARRPWESSRDPVPINLQGQKQALEALFASCMPQKWFAGGFLWKWYPRIRRPERIKGGYTPQGKPAESLLKDWYSRYQADTD